MHRQGYSFGRNTARSEAKRQDRRQASRRERRLRGNGVFTTKAPRKSGLISTVWNLRSSEASAVEKIRNLTADYSDFTDMEPMSMLCHVMAVVHFCAFCASSRQVVEN
jgi:hypothetical protein